MKITIKNTAGGFYLKDSKGLPVLKTNTKIDVDIDRLHTDEPLEIGQEFTFTEPKKWDRETQRLELVDGNVVVKAKPIDIEQIKQDKVEELNTYDKSIEVNETLINGNSFWLGKELRYAIYNDILAEKEQGATTTKLSILGQIMDIEIDKALHILQSLFMYAKECFGVTDFHKIEINKLTTKEEIDNYDFKVGYPDKLNFEL